MISNQALVTALNGLVVLAADRKKVKSANFQEKLISAMTELAEELQARGADIRSIKIKDAESNSATWGVPFVADTGNMKDVRFLIRVPDLI